MDTQNGIDFRLTPADWAFVTLMLSRPFELTELKTRPQGSSALVYTDARVYSDRLDFVVGNQNWSIEQTPVTIQDDLKIDITPEDAPRYPNGKPKSPVYKHGSVYYGGIQTTLSIFGVAKSDAGNPSMADQLKGAYSDGLKRAGVLWGIGRYLYGLKNVTAITPERLPEHALPWEWPDFDADILDTKRSILGILNELNNNDISNDVKNRVYDLDSTFIYHGSPLVYKNHVLRELTRIERSLKAVSK